MSIVTVCAVFIGITLLFSVFYFIYLFTSQDSVSVCSAFSKFSFNIHYLAVCCLPKLVFMSHLIIASVFFYIPIIFF